MCFLKTFKQLDAIPLEKGPLESQAEFSEKMEKGGKNHSFLNDILESKVPVLYTKQDDIIFKLLNLINSNNKHLEMLDEKISFNEKHLSSFVKELDHMPEEDSCLKNWRDPSELSSEEMTQQHQPTEVDPLLEKVFGPKKYEYRLQLSEELPTTIYKERNVNIGVLLTDRQNQKVLNSNIVHLCLGVCDANGEWVTQNKAKEDFMKGKTEIQLYHGEGSFLKIYPRQVSRSYAQGRLNFIIYAKPSVLQFSNGSSGVEREVDSRLIEPLLLKDLQIKAKKKE